ncbi:MAG: hypothetical protein SO160_11480 [Lachnospiraceae bacterium]|nr:hypothetical protein [Lachnospiraceae bacterium]
MTITKKLTNDQLLNAIYRSAAEYENLLDKDFLIIGKIENRIISGLNAFLRRKILCIFWGIKSRTMSADEFFIDAFYIII